MRSSSVVFLAAAVTAHNLVPSEDSVLSRITFSSCAHQDPGGFGGDSIFFESWDTFANAGADLALLTGDNVYGDCVTTDCAELKQARPASLYTRNVRARCTAQLTTQPALANRLTTSCLRSTPSSGSRPRCRTWAPGMTTTCAAAVPAPRARPPHTLDTIPSPPRTHSSASTTAASISR